MFATEIVAAAQQVASEIVNCFTAAGLLAGLLLIGHGLDTLYLGNRNR